jgi:hypothetical protein
MLGIFTNMMRRGIEILKMKMGLQMMSVQTYWMVNL